MVGYVCYVHILCYVHSFKLCQRLPHSLSTSLIGSSHLLSRSAYIKDLSYLFVCLTKCAVYAFTDGQSCEHAGRHTHKRVHTDTFVKF